MDDLYLARKGNMQMQCQPELVKPLSDAGYTIFKYVTVEMTAEEINKVAKERGFEAIQ